MKKMICMAVLIALMINLIPNDAEAVDNYYEETTTKSAKNYSPVPCYGEYVIEESDNMTRSSGTQDRYEDNNSFSSATQILGKPNGRPTDTTVDITATLHQGKWFFELIEKNADEDYYYFDLYGEAEVMLELSNIPVGYDYDLEIYKQSNVRFLTAAHVEFVEESSFDSNSVERIALTLQPGRYYIWVYSYGDACNDSAYNLSLDVDYNAQDVSINYLRYNKGAKAAIWVSDFDPCGIAPFSTLKNEGIALDYMNVVSGIYYDYYENNFLETLPNQHEIEHAVIYIWDAELAEDIISDLVRFRNEIEAELPDIENKQFMVNVTEQTVNDFGIVTSILFDMGDTVSVISTVASIAVNVLRVLLPFEEEMATKEMMITYLDDLIEDVNVCVQTNGNVTVKIYSSYTLYDTEIDDAEVYYCDYTPLNSNNNFYFEDVIPAYSENTIVNGRIYGIVDGGNVVDALNREDYELPNVNFEGCTYVYSGYRRDGNINVGEYQWYYLIAPRDGWYRLYTYGNIDVIGELFYGRVPDNSTFGRIAYEDDLYEADDGSDPDENFSILINVTAGTRIFLRVSTRDSGTYTLIVEKLD